MILFNRIGVTLLCLITLVAAMALLAAPDMVFSQAQTWVLAASMAPQWSRMWIAIAVAAVSLLLLWLEHRPRRVLHAFEARVNGGTVVYPPESVASAVEKELITLEGVRHVKAEATGYGRRVDMRLRLVTDAGYDPQTVAARVVARLRETVEKGLGLRLRSPWLSIETAESVRVLEERTATVDEIPNLAEEHPAQPAASRP